MESADITGDVHRLWQIDRTEQIESIRAELKDKAVFIADGHHRYETALEFHRETALKEPFTGCPRLSSCTHVPRQYAR